MGQPRKAQSTHAEPFRWAHGSSPIIATRPIQYLAKPEGLAKSESPDKLVSKTGEPSARRQQAIRAAHKKARPGPGLKRLSKGYPIPGISTHGSVCINQHA